MKRLKIIIIIFRPPGKPPKWDKNKQYFPPVDNSIDKVDSNSEKVDNQHLFLFMNFCHAF